jgi:hypothetical protein
MDKSIEHELLAVVGQLSPREAQLVIEYARILHSTPISEVSRAYLDTLAQLGVSSTELLRAAQATQRVEERLAQIDPQQIFYDLEQRTDNYMRSWLQERGIDYEATSEKLFDEIVDGIIQQRRHRK